MYGYVFHGINGPNHGQASKTQWFLLNDICMDNPLAGLLWERQLEEVLLVLAGKKYRTGNVF